MFALEGTSEDHIVQVPDIADSLEQIAQAVVRWLLNITEKEASESLWAICYNALSPTY